MELVVVHVRACTRKHPGTSCITFDSDAAAISLGTLLLSWLHKGVGL